jgi:hypothetical protein
LPRNLQQGLVFPLRTAILRTMNVTEKTVLLGLGVGLMACAVSAVPPAPKSGDYSVIVTRNPFGLVDPPPPAPPKVDPPKPVEAEPPPNVELTGFWRNSQKGKTVALFLVEPKKGEKKVSYMWAEGEGDGGMKVLAINEAEETVKFSLRGVESTITFSKPQPVAAPVAVAPGRGAPGTPGRLQPGAPSIGAAAVAPAQAVQQFESARPGRFGRTGSTTSAVGGAASYQNATGQPGGLQSVPVRNLRVPGNTTQGDQQTPALTPREQEVLIEVNREVLKQTGQINIMPPLPPTSLTTDEDLRRIVAPPPIPQ